MGGGAPWSRDGWAAALNCEQRLIFSVGFGEECRRMVEESARWCLG